MLVNHQVVAPGGSAHRGDYVAPLKRAHIDDEGTLRLAWWDGNAALKGNTSAGPLNGTLGSVVEGSVALPAGGALSLAPCGSPSDSGSSVEVNGTSLTMQIAVDGKVIEHVDRALGAVIPRVRSGATNFTLLQRKGMFEFYLGGFLALPERLDGVHDCLELRASGGLRVERTFEMVRMPIGPPVPEAPTWPQRRPQS
jgi:hypothetical protein